MTFLKSIIIMLIVTSALRGDLSNDILRIGVSKGDGVFADWLKKADASIEVIDLYLLPEEESIIALQQCSGVIFSGGPDLDPAYYGKPEKASLCYINAERDRREWILAKAAIERNIPLFCICRGFQLLNVFFGGTLIADILTETASEVAHYGNGEFAYHVIAVEEGTLLRSIVPFNRPVVNSYHHQGIDRLADTFLPSARSNDELIEAYEWKEKENKPFLLGVEWHPECMTDLFSKCLARAFVEAVKKERNSNVKPLYIH